MSHDCPSRGTLTPASERISPEIRSFFFGGSGFLPCNRAPQSGMTETTEPLYRGYIDCLNARDLARLGAFVDRDVDYNGTRIGLEGYRAMLERDVAAIPDLRFVIALLVCDARTVAARLVFDVTPTGLLFDLPVNGRRVRFTENVFYEVEARKIRRVWSLIDTDAIAAQL